MGGHQSRIEETNIDESDGRMAPGTKCVAANTPTTGTREVTLHRLEHLNNRKYDIKMGDEMICMTRQATLDIETFDLFGPDGKTKLVLCHKAVAEKIWHIASYVTPAFEGQKVDKEMYDIELKMTTKKPFYKSYELVWNHSRKVGELCPVFKDDSGLGKAGDPIYEIQKIKGIKERYQICHVGEDASLVAHWHWKGQNIELIVAKGSDLALYSVIAVICGIMKETEGFPYFGLFTN